MAKKNFIQAWTDVILGTANTEDAMPEVEVKSLTAAALPRVKETLCKKCNVDINDAACGCDVPFIFGESELSPDPPAGLEEQGDWTFKFDPLAHRLFPSGDGDASKDWKVVALREATHYCLGCEKEGHRTDECHSTSGFNTPRQMELARLAWIANGSIAASDAAQKPDELQTIDVALESPPVSLQPVLPDSPTVWVEDVPRGTEIVPWKTAEEWAQAYGDACYAAGKRAGPGKS